MLADEHAAVAGEKTTQDGFNNAARPKALYGLSRLVVLLAILGATWSVACSSPANSDGPLSTLELRLSTQTAQLSVTLPSVVPFEAPAVAARESLRISDGAQVLTPDGVPALVANAGSSESNLGARAVSGSIWSLSPVYLRNGSHVEGDVASARQVDLQAGATVSGTVRANQALAVTTHTWEVTRATSGTQDVNLEPDQSRTLTPGFYGNLSVKSRSKLTLTPGAYYFRSFFIEPDARLVLDGSQEPTVITVEYDLTFRGSATTTSGGSPRALFQVLGSGTVAIEAPFSGSVVAPNAYLKLAGNNATHHGTFLGRTVEIAPSVRVIQRTFPLNLLRPPGPHGLRPAATCVRKVAADQYIAVFGYSNGTSAPVAVPLGAGNAFTGALAVDGPPTFLPGFEEYSHVASFSGDGVTWSLDGLTAEVSRRSVPCSQLEFAAVQDATVMASAPDLNQGSAATLALGPGNLSLVSFDLRAIRSALGSAFLVERATLQLEVQQGSPVDLQLLELTQTWTEQATWRCAQRTASTCTQQWTLGAPGRPPYNPWRDRAPTEPPSSVTLTSNVLSADVTQDLERALYPGFDAYGWALRLPTGSAVITARESGRPPKLVIELASRGTPGTTAPAPLRVEVDGSLQPTRSTVPALDPSRPDRAVGVLSDPDGKTTELVERELILETGDAQILQGFLSRWQGQVVHAYPIPKRAPLTRYIIEMDPTRAHEGAVETYLGRIDNRPSGTHRVSTPGVRQLLAAAAESAFSGTPVDINWLKVDSGSFVDRAITEGPDKSGYSVGRNPFSWPHMSTSSAWATGVAEAWRLLYIAKGLGPSISVGIHDRGFSAHADYPLSAEFHALGPYVPFGPRYDGSWHGTYVTQAGFGAVDNSFGAAGPGGPVSHIVGMRVEGELGPNVDGIDELNDRNVRIINMSWHFELPAIATVAAQGMGRAVKRAHDEGILLFAAAGNDGDSVDEKNCILGTDVGCYESRLYYPCELDHVTCVGGLAYDSSEHHMKSNYGSDSVDIWAPYEVFIGDVTATGSDSDFHIRAGTSYATPFAAGIAALAWFANPDASPGEVLDALYAKGIAGDGRANGWFTALPTVHKMLSDAGEENLPARLTIDLPQDHTTISYESPLLFSASAVTLYADEEHEWIYEDPSAEVKWVLDGPIDQSPTWSERIEFGPMSGVTMIPIPGDYVLTASFITADGRDASDSVVIHVVNSPPVIQITKPESVDAQSITLWSPGPNVIAAAAFDLEDGSLCASLEWTVVGGHIEPGSPGGCYPRKVWIDDPLGAELHLSVTDSDGQVTTLSKDVAIWGQIPGMLPVLDIIAPSQGTGYHRGATIPLDGAVLALAPEDTSYSWWWRLITPYGDRWGLTADDPVGTMYWDTGLTFPPDAPEFNNGVVPVTLEFNVLTNTAKHVATTVDVYFLQDGTLLPTCDDLTCADNSHCVASCGTAGGSCRIPPGEQQGCCECLPG